MEYPCDVGVSICSVRRPFKDFGSFFLGARVWPAPPAPMPKHAAGLCCKSPMAVREFLTEFWVRRQSVAAIVGSFVPLHSSGHSPSPSFSNFLDARNTGNVIPPDSTESMSFLSICTCTHLYAKFVTVSRSGAH